MEDSRLWQYLAEHGDISRKPLCHLYTYHRRSGSLKAHSNVILATTVTDLGAKTSQWSTQSYQKCSDARESRKKLASRTEGGTMRQMRAAMQGFGAKSLRRELEGGTLCERSAVTQGNRAQNLRR